eukprot:416064_1
MTGLDKSHFELWVIIVVMNYILAIFQILGFFRFKSLSKLIIIQKRYPAMVLMEAVASMGLLFFGMPIYQFICLNPFNTHTYKFQKYGFLVILVCTHFIINIETARLWLMSFELNYLHSSKNEQWKSHIDTSFAEKDWYLRNKATFGNKKYVLHRVLVWYIFSATLSFIIHVTISRHYFFIAQLVDGILYGVGILTIFYLLWKCPKGTNDLFLFYFEFKTSTFFFGAGLTIYLCNEIIFILGFDTINYIIVAFDGMIGMTFPSLFSTLWIPKKLLLDRAWSDRSNSFSHFSVSNDVAIMQQIQHTNKKKEEHENIMYTKLINTFKTEDMFEGFVQWMYREFSSETILCFIELNQFKQYLINFAKTNGSYNMDTVVLDSNTGHKKQTDYEFYDSIPKSTIIYGNATTTSTPNSKSNAVNSGSSTLECHDFKQQAHQLFEKYIKLNSELEVNISSNLRNEYYKLDENNYDMDIVALVTVFDEVIAEMFKFMQQSFVRYQTQH